MLGLLGAIELAREQGDPNTMIRGAAELSKMLGFYAPKKTDKGKYGVGEGEYQKPLELMSDLLSVILNNTSRFINTG